MGNDPFVTFKAIWADIQSLLRDEGEVAAIEGVRPSRLRRFLAFCFLVGMSYVRNRCLIRASSLTYTTILALIPVLAIAISISTWMLHSQQGQVQIEQKIGEMIDKVAPQLGLVAQADPSQDARKKVAEFIQSSINNVNSGALGTTAMVALIFIAISMLSSIENTMNDIWGVGQGRSWISRILNYWAVVTFGPILLLLAMGLNAGPYFEFTRKLIEYMPWLSRFLYDLIPLTMIVLGFTVFYWLMPNTSVSWKAALAGGVVGGLLFHLNNTFSTLYYGQVVRNSMIYGSLGIVPVFLLGTYFSWVILLFGAQVAYAWQNRRVYFEDRLADHIHQRGREFVGLRLMVLVAGRFLRREKAPTLAQISEALAVPARLTQRLVDHLIQTGLLVEIHAVGKAGECGYQPARPIDDITFHDILEALRSGRGHELSTREGAQCDRVRTELARVRAAERQTSAHITLEQLVRQDSSS